MSRELSEAFGRLVQQRREQRKLSRAELARLSGLHQTYIGLLERGKRSPNLETAQAIARSLEIPLARLIAKAEKS